MAEKQENKNTQNNNSLLKWVLIAVAVIAAGYLIYTYAYDGKKEKQQYKVKDQSELLKDVKEPQFVKQGELEFFKKDGKTKITKIDIEIADNDQKTTQGLMYRKSMEENRGMLFIFPKADMHNFWMKNTIMSLDIIFISEKKEIINIHKNTIPYSEKHYPSLKPALFVLEVNAGYSDKYGIKEGDIISFTRTQ